jgi:hypothetical protein
MRKQILFLLVMFALSLGCKAKHVSLAASNRPETTLTPQYPKTPPRPMTIDVTGLTLTLFSAFEDVVMVELLDEDENVVYIDWLAPGQTSLVFPNTLSGEYTIGLTVGSVYYIGVIEL